MWTKTDDGSIVDDRGKVIFFSTERFKRDICLGNCCFICGARPEDKKFNNEHILPEWLLRRYDLFSRTITLPNEGTVQYGRYTVPCCADCNSLMGTVIEGPISQVVAGGAQAINDYISNGGLLNIFVWMGLIYVKTHLKDRMHRVHLDARKGTQKIGDEYEWERLHHIHCIVRCFYTGCSVMPEALGSFLALPVIQSVSLEQFDFADLYLAQTMLLRLGDVGIVTVFDDSQGAMNFFMQKAKKFTGPVSQLQLREIMAELAFLNLHLKERPIFKSDCDAAREDCTIVATRPQLGMSPLEPNVRGRLLHHVLRDAIPGIRVPGHTQEEIVESIKAGGFSLLFNEKGEFIKQTALPD
jgi:hypothetical protein